MVTARRIVAAALLGVMATLAACSREQQDWRAAEGKDSAEAYGQFIDRHPDSELVKEARARIAQLAEDRDWSDAAKADTAAAYQLFLTQHPAGKWAQEARIRVQNFSLAAAGGDLAGVGTADTGPPAGSMPAAAESGAPAVPGPGAVANTTPVLAAAPGPNTVTAARAVPGESAVPAGRVAPAGSPAPPATAASAASALPAPGATLPAVTAALAPTATPAVAATPASTTQNVYGIQLGAFTSEDRANSEWRALQARFAPQLQGLAPQVVAAETASGRVFRLQALGGDEARARLICEQLRERSQGCVPVIPH